MLEVAHTRSPGRQVAVCVLFLISSACSRQAHDHDHAGGEPEGLDPIAITVFTEKVALFMEYPRMTPGVEARFLAHVTVLATGEPVRSGSLRLKFAGEGGTKTLDAPAPARDGLFIPVGAIDRLGRYEASIVVESEQVTDTIVLPPIVVHADLAAAGAAAQADAGDDPADAVPFLLEQQWKIGLLMVQAERRTLTRRLRVPGHVEAPTGSMAIVSAPLAGRLQPPESGFLPRLGERVEKGQVLALVEPPLAVADLAQQAANEMTLATLDMEFDLRGLDLRASELQAERQGLQAQTRLAFARQSLERIERLRAKGLGTVAELEAARRDSAMAARDSESFQALKKSFVEAREQLETMRTRGVASRPETGRRLAVPLVAPISGEIVEAPHTIGEHVDLESVPFRILKMERVWITADVSEFDLSRIEDAPHALIELAAGPGRLIDVFADLGGELTHTARLVDPDTRTVAFRYECVNRDKTFRVGQLADVFLAAGTATDVVVIPEAAIVKDGGRPVAFVLLDGETFQKRTLELGVRDGDQVEVKSGIEEGERVVTSGAYLVKLASASPASFGEGHAH